MNPYLHLFIEVDYIIPVVDDYDGNLIKYNNCGETRLWLYFYDSPHKSGLDYGRTFKLFYEAERPGYIGDFWGKVENGESYNNGIAQVSYCDLLEHSGILPELRKFYSENTGITSGQIPLVLTFSSSIKRSVRKIIINYLSSIGFEILSFSSSIESLCTMKVLSDHKRMKPEFGNKILYFQSSGKNLILSTMVFDGYSFLPTNQKSSIEYEGDRFILRKLVEYIVNKVDENNSFLSSRDRSQEYNFQMQRAEEWYNRLLKESSFTIDDFYYSSDFDKMSPYSCRVDGKYLSSVLENAIVPIINRIQKFKNEVIKNDLFMTILIGDIFEDKMLHDKIINIVSSIDKVRYFHDFDVQVSMDTYRFIGQNYKENISDFETINRNTDQAIEAISNWVISAERIRLLRDDFAITCDQMETEERTLTREISEMKLKWESEMKQSHFDKADEVLSNSFSSEQSLNILTRKANELFIQKESNSALFDTAKQFEGAKEMILSIETLDSKLSNSVQQWIDACEMRKVFTEKTNYYRNNYINYQEKLNVFKKETNRQLLERMLKELKELTMEPLPEIFISDMNIRIEAEIVKEGGFFKKKKKINVRISIESGRELPCGCLLIISPTVLNKVQRNGVFIEEFEQGLFGVLERSYYLPLENVGKASELYVYFWPDEKAKISINSFNENLCSVKI